MSDTLDRLLFNLQFLEWRHLADGKDPIQRLSRSLSRTSKSDHPKLTAEFFASRGHPPTPSEGHDLEAFRKGFAELFDRADDFAYKPIVHAFQRAKLDIKDPLHWRWLMLLLCWAHFPPRRAGRNRVWTTDNYIKLLQDVDRIKIEYRIKSEHWLAPGSEDTELGVLMEPEVRDGEAEVHARRPVPKCPDLGSGRTCDASRSPDWRTIIPQ